MSNYILRVLYHFQHQIPDKLIYVLSKFELLTYGQKIQYTKNKLNEDPLLAEDTKRIK